MIINETVQTKIRLRARSWRLVRSIVFFISGSYSTQKSIRMLIICTFHRINTLTANKKSVNKSASFLLHASMSFGKEIYAARKKNCIHTHILIDYHCCFCFYFCFHVSWLWVWAAVRVTVFFVLCVTPSSFSSHRYSFPS